MFSIRATLFHRVGGYDEALRYAENTELALRLAKSLEPGVSEAVLIDDRFLLSIERRTDRPQGSARVQIRRRPPSPRTPCRPARPRPVRSGQPLRHRRSVSGSTPSVGRRAAALAPGGSGGPVEAGPLGSSGCCPPSTGAGTRLAFIEMTDTRIARAASVSSETVGRFETVRPAGAPPRIPAGRIFQHWALRPA